MSTPVKADELRRELREDSSAFLFRRRGIAGLMLFSTGVLGGIALYQLGIIKKLPEPSWRGFDSEKVNGSGQAYSLLATPDALLGLLSYSVTACLAGMGSKDRWRTHSWLPISMAAKIFADAVFAGKLTIDQSRKYQAFSFWSLLAAGATFISVPLAMPEAHAALSQLTRGKGGIQRL